jgi:hypothetical protein
MRLLLDLEANLRAERVTSNFALGQPYPLSDQVKRQLAGVRKGTDLAIGVLGRQIRATANNDADGIPSDPYLTTTVGKLSAVRATIDELLISGEPARTFSTLVSIIPRMIAVAQVLDGSLQRASVAVVSADPSLYGLVTEDRLAASLRDQVGLIASVVLPRFNTGKPPTAADMEQVRNLFVEASYLTRLLSDTIAIAGPTDRIKAALAGVMAIDIDGILQQLIEPGAPAATSAAGVTGPALPQQLLMPWGARINDLHTAFVNATMQRVTETRVWRERQFDIVMTAFGVVVVAVLESVLLLSQRVVIPLAHLGQAITRIAAGERGIALRMPTGTREIAEMATAVETLRQAALVADAAALRHQLVARHRLETLRQALGIVQTVQEPAHALELGIARLSEGIDATIAFVTAATVPVPSSLGTAAAAVRVGLAEIRGSVPDLEATFAAAGSAQSEDRPEAEFLAHILAVQQQVDRRSVAVRAFVQPSLVALRDATSASGLAVGPVLHELVSDQFERIEETVAMVAAMLAAVARASAIVRGLPVQDLSMERQPMAA